MQTNFEINIGIKSDVGCLRKNNEDYTTYYIPSDPRELQKNGSLFIVADGVGGAAKGEVASRYAADAVLFEYYNTTTLPPSERLAFAMQKANHEIFQHSQENGNFMRMATTMVAALILNNMLIIAHVGDSRLYLLREGKIQQITRDHSVVAEMVRNGAMTEEEARTSKAKNRLTRSIGGDPEVHVEVSQPIPLNLKDRILICSDGLTRYLDGEELRAAAQEGAVASTAQELVKYARQHGGADNISVILLEVVQKAKSRKLKVVLPPSPEKLGWDEMETEYPPQIPVSERRKIPVWGMVGVAAAILVLTGILLFGGKEKEDQGTSFPPDVQATEKAQGILVTQSDDDKKGDEQSNGEEIVTTQENTSVPEEIPTETPITPTEVSNWQCVYEVEGGDTIEKIQIKFGLSGNHIISGGKDAKTDSFDFYNAEDCLIIEEKNLSCELDKENTYENNNTIYPGEWIIIYSSLDGEILYKNEEGIESVWSRVECENLGGYIKEGGNE